MLKSSIDYQIKEGLAGSTYQKIPWMRTLIVAFTSEKLKSRIVFGEESNNEYSISVDGYKYMSALKDNCTIKIDNLTYSDIIQLIDGEYYNVEIYCGYKSGVNFKIFEGGVLYISNNLGDRKTSTAIILCASKLVAKYGQKRINLSLRSGINMYSALKFICERAGIQDSDISIGFKTKVLQNVVNVNNTVGGFFENLADTNDTYILNSDGTSGSTLGLFDISQTRKRTLEITSADIDLSGGYPRLNSSGLTVTLSPTFPFICGDIIQLDNSLINISVDSSSEANKLYGSMLDENSCYVIYQISYRLQNRGSDFTEEFLCKPMNRMRNITGG